VLGGIDVFGNAIDVLADNEVPYVGGIPISTQSVQSENSYQWSGGTWGAAVAFAEHAATTLMAERVAVVYGEFGSITQAAEYAERVLERNDVETQLVPYPILATDLVSAMQAAAASDPDAIFVLAADAGCRAGFEAIATLGLDTQKYFVGACAAPTIIDSVDASATEGTIFNVEGPISSSSPDPDVTFYDAVIERYTDGLDPVGAGTVSFRSFMNLYAVLVELGADGATRAAIAERLDEQRDAPSFMGHPYTCDREQFEGLPAMCSPQQILGQREGGELDQITDWMDVGDIYAG
jgi:branched-chain amino acid transport system substrate-binding protein